jgi:large subunit ribosomal protein L31
MSSAEHVVAVGRGSRAGAASEEERVSARPELWITSVRCSSCGNEFVTRSTRERIEVEVCSSCHPAYTGVERPMAHGSRSDRFERRRRLASGRTSARPARA